MSEVSVSLAAKLGSIVVHAEEAVSPDGHALDVEAIRGLIADPEVQAFLDDLRKLALLPVKRRAAASGGRKAT